MNLRNKFTIVTEDGIEFTDALYLTDAEYDALTEAELAAMRQARFDAWVNAIKFPPQPDIPEIQNIVEEVT